MHDAGRASRSRPTSVLAISVAEVDAAERSIIQKGFSIEEAG
jgi:hypothetical protein